MITVARTLSIISVMHKQKKKTPVKCLHPGMAEQWYPDNELFCLHWTIQWAQTNKACLLQRQLPHMTNATFHCRAEDVHMFTLQRLHVCFNKSWPRWSAAERRPSVKMHRLSCWKHHLLISVSVALNPYRSRGPVLTVFPLAHLFSDCISTRGPTVDWLVDCCVSLARILQQRPPLVVVNPPSVSH